MPGTQSLVVLYAKTDQHEELKDPLKKIEQQDISELFFIGYTIRHMAGGSVF